MTAAYNTNPLTNGNVIDPIDQMRHGEWLRDRRNDIDAIYYGGHRALHNPFFGSRLRELSKHTPKHAQQTVTATLDVPETPERMRFLGIAHSRYGAIQGGIDPRALPKDPPMKPGQLRGAFKG